MKTIKLVRPDPPKAPWTGEQFTCTCGTVVEFEEGDFHPSFTAFTCPGCREFRQWKADATSKKP